MNQLPYLSITIDMTYLSLSLGVVGDEDRDESGYGRGVLARLLHRWTAGEVQTE